MAEFEVVRTNRGPLEFIPVELFHGRGAINPVQSARNLLDLSDILDKSRISHGLIYGTLLGAVRDAAFIPWDEDVDVFIGDEDRSKLLDCLWELRDHGFELVRCDGDLYSVMRDGDYVDIYVFRHVGARRWCNSDMLLGDHFNFDGRVEFLGRNFCCPAPTHEFLKLMYGEDWRTPRQNYPARPWSAWRKFKRVLRDAFPKLAELYFKAFR